ncbi:lysophospholipid acyltransferase family protein [Dokdonella sp.]|uniref:lysophospholipid acyltransferase family protein n=1 Tax=Dokdonella sp. TaxID=2291710 RepID=UPI002F3E74D7
MISVERSFYEKFPRLAEGRARALAQPVVALLRRIACEERINAILGQAASLRGFAFVEHVLEHLKVSYSIANTDRENIPVEGRAVIVANHPLGALDALALIHLVGSVRRDVKVLANDVLMQFDALSSLLLPLPVFGAGSALGGARAAYRALERDEALVVFPSGEVSRMGAQGVRDSAWSAGFARLAMKTGSPVLPVHITAQNSPMFYGVSMLAKPLAALMLAREIFTAERARIGFQVGEIVPEGALRAASGQPDRIARQMRRHVYRLARRRPTVFPTSTAIAHPESPLAVRRALRAAEPLGHTFDGKQILLLEADPDCAALREIGRLRELAFRRVGEGTGARRDLDRYDAHYRHLVLWDEHALAIVGAYRLGEAGAILRERGLDGLYSASLFDYAPEARTFLDQAVELGRSFVQPAYWGSRSLDYLWQGIGAYLRGRPHLRYLLGPVSLSAALPFEAREWIVHYHRHYFGAGESLARARNPFVISAHVEAAATAAWAGRPIEEGIGVLRARLAALDAPLPVLYRQYADLCEADGVRFLDFGVDPAFGGCVDGLVRLDLGRLRPAKRARYLEPASRRSERPAA